MAKQEVIGTFKAASGIIIIGDTSLADEKWVTAQRSNSGVAVDIVGQKAEWLAKRGIGQQHRVEKIDDKTWRIICTDPTQARVLADQASKQIERDGLKLHSVTVRPLGATKTIALDAARKTGVGMGDAQGAKFGAILAREGQLVEVREVRDAAGELLYVMVVPLTAPK